MSLRWSQNEGGRPRRPNLIGLLLIALACAGSAPAAAATLTLEFRLSGLDSFTKASGTLVIDTSKARRTGAGVFENAVTKMNVEAEKDGESLLFSAEVPTTSVVRFDGSRVSVDASLPFISLAGMQVQSIVLELPFPRGALPSSSFEGLADLGREIAVRGARISVSNSIYDGEVHTARGTATVSVR